VKISARTLAEMPRLAGQLAAADEQGAAMTAAPGPGWVLVQDQLYQESGHDIGADPGS
jgi:hypothetical protein